ncbi:hypothetical protein AAHA92_24416 [Salvia divinorum]|uniref:Uncharacterized protein n=1 Tax=Salvia divinorum TaxID=28513 RepID=A0ABD1G7A1_SALDI
MKNGEGSTSKQRVAYEYDFFDENRTGPIRSFLVPIGREATPAEMKNDEGSTTSKQRVVHEYNFMDENRAGLIRTLFPRFDKTLEAIDMSNTLFVSGSERVMRFLTEEERGKVEIEGFLEVPTEDQSGNGYMMRLRQSSIFIGVAEISGEWFKLVSHNKLKKGDWVYGWGYRKDGQFRIVIKYYPSFKAPCDEDEELQ